MGGVIAFPPRTPRRSTALAAGMGGLTHDLRNVMASLELCAEVLAQPDVLMPEHAYLAGEMRSVADAGIGLLRRMRDLAEPREGRRPYQGAQQRLRPPAGPGIETVLSRMRGLLAAVVDVGVTVEMECAPCWGQIAMASEDLARILLNLVRNACDAMPRGGRIRITAQMSDGQSFAGDPAVLPLRQARAVLVTVQDDGSGVPPELAGHIFQAGFSTRRGNQGAQQMERSPMSCRPGEARPRGLGLAISRELAEASGGSLRLVPSACGARFELEIPLTNVTSPEGSKRRIDPRGGRA